MSSAVITIGREYGSGGRLIAQRVADQLKIPFYDKEIISGVAKKTGLAESFIREAERHHTRSFIYDLYYSTQNLSISDQVFIAEAGIIKEKAAKGGCVIVGRCADYVLRDCKRLLRVFVHAPLDQRLRRVREEYGVQDKELEDYVAKLDKKRASYYNFFTDRRWGDAHNYDLCINSSMGLDTAADIICHTARNREEHKDA